MSRTKRQAEKASKASTVPNSWSAAARIAVSVLLLVHVVALVVGPMAVPPSSIVVTRTWDVYQPYLEAAYLNHGYHFFAPEPGPSHMVRYELELADGATLEGIFPNLQEHWPRLLYHRHFMLSERLASAPPESEWIQRYTESYANHLLKTHDAKSVTLYLRQHAIPFPDQVQEGMKLTDPSLYQERLLGTFTGDAS